MLTILRQIARTGIRTEPTPLPSDEAVVVAASPRHAEVLLVMDSVSRQMATAHQGGHDL